MEKKMKALMTNPSIPQHIILEIFSWLPVKSLKRFKCVARFYNSLVISDIAKFFLYESLQGVLYAIEQKGDDGKASILHYENLDKVLDDNRIIIPRIVGANGLFCLWGSSHGRAAIFNPCTREVRFLPKYNDDFYMSEYDNYSLGFEPEEKKYKVLWTVGNNYFVRNWILTIGIDESWKEIINSNPPFILDDSGVCINGVLYWFNNYPNEGGIIAAFDIKSENFRSVTLWNATCHMTYNNYKLVEVNGKLGVMDCKNLMSGYINLWTFVNIRQGNWESQIIRLPLQWNDIDYMSYSFCNIYRDGEILFIVKTELADIITCLCYDVKKKSWREFEIMGIPVKNNINSDSYISNVYSRIETLSPTRHHF